MKILKQIFCCQEWHFLFLTLLLLPFYFAQTLFQNPWFGIALSIPILHQLYVWFIWRVELYTNYFTNKFGLQKAFHLYTIGFSILFSSRLLFIIILAYTDKNSLDIEVYFPYTLAIIITPFVVYLFYSVKKYFTIERAYGIDHFDKNYNVAFVKKGIFKYTNNGMYVVGLSILYLPGLLFLSKSALIIALFNHAYIWVHYFFTEKPDMKVIYGSTP